MAIRLAEQRGTEVASMRSGSDQKTVTVRLTRAATKGVRAIRGLETPDERTLVIRLMRPVAATVAAAPVLPITLPVPEEHAAPHDRKSPTGYDRSDVLGVMNPYTTTWDLSFSALRQGG